MFNVIKNVIFHNQFHNGDIHMSREYVKDISNIFGNACFYYYRHNRSSKLLKDIKHIQHIDNDETLEIIKNSDTSLLFNTWVASDRNYFNGCNFVGYYSLMQQYYKLLNIEDKLKPIEHYVPSVNYEEFQISNVKTYFNQTTKRHVLFCNNHANSGQVSNFDMDYILEKICVVFPDINFVVSNRLKQIDAPNVIFAEDIIGPTDDNNLYEISYLSTFCDTIIGRSSGPYSFSITKDNVNTKKFICMCTNWTDAWFLPETKNISWTNATDLNFLSTFIAKELT